LGRFLAFERAREWDFEFRLADKTGKLLYEVMDGWQKILTNRQFEAWKVWEVLDYNHPSRTDYYLMEVVNSLVERGYSPLKFYLSSENNHLVDGVEMSKSSWLSVCGEARELGYVLEVFDE